VAVYRISKGCCACGTCICECLANAITMDVTTGAHIDEEACVGCGACYENCPSEAIEKIEDPEGT